MQKAKLLIELRSPTGVIKAGTIFDEPFPDFIVKRIQKRQVEVFEVKELPKKVPIIVSKKETEKSFFKTNEKPKEGGQSDENTLRRKSEDSER